MTNKIPAVCPSWLSYLLILCFSISALTTVAQDKGDEDKTMANTVKTRDQKAIEEAMHGWWPASMKTRDARIAWWRDARFGMFIHWGIYSLPAGEWDGKNTGGYAEHLMRKAKIPRSTYLELAHRFNPVKFNPDKWVQAAKYAGMRYLIITAKHHDGFAMYNSQVSDYNVVKQTTWKHDPMVDLAAACKKYGIKFGFYYSHAFDWEHPDAPGNDWDYQNPGGDLNLFGGRDWYDLHPELLPKAVNYVNKKAIPQIKELITKYHPDILWFDTPQKLPLSENIRILKAIRETDPNIVVNGRLVRGNGNLQMGDYKNTGDRPAEFFPASGDWEAIPTTNESYGYSKFDKSHKPVGFFIRLLAKAASRGGNLLMNIGPMGNGEFAPEDTAILQGIGRWMSKNSASIYQTTKTPLPYQSWGVSTRKNNLLYLHVFNWPKNGKLIVGGLKSKVNKVWLLADKKELQFTRIDPLDIAIHLPVQAPDTSNTVLLMETTGSIETDTLRLLASRETTNRLLAFDARLEGKGFGFGDGKTNSYYVEGWKNTHQSVNWDFRLIEPATYKILLKYVADNVDDGTYELSIGTLKVKGSIDAIPKGAQVKEQVLGTVTLEPGVHSLTIAPVEIKKAGLMKILEVRLIPVGSE
ncbi:Alpha-L-fucosidase [Mucilaginibacter sp. OK268]|uniref:alpha-L-fucosidase n=1 Tax=Mucilaginibacter sp. OK268 TaxID=1881048 RepID=UPI00088EE1A3|nr:alpha-L-fucosidase [Mucilaginibacter sp. OK268]SDQ01327.1 Alpha-L-fucosidase [Mucilaginibacter sp. OK268]